MAYKGTDSYYTKLMDEIEGCILCDLSGFRTNIVTYRGNPRSDLMVIAEAPGNDEDLRGKPMVGKSGTYFVKTFGELGMALDDYIIINTISCRPPGNADPTPDQLAACSKWMYWHIDNVNPRLIIACGRYAASRLIPEFNLKSSRITQLEGKVFTPPHLGGIEIIPIQHPSAIMRSASPIKTEKYREVIEGIIKHYRKP